MAVMGSENRDPSPEELKQRAYSTFSRFMGRYVRDPGVMSLPTASATSLPNLPAA